MSVVVVESFDNWPAERLETEITLVAAHLAAAECQWLLMVGAFDRRQAWATWGCASAAHWLNWRCGLAIGAARERVRVARRLAELTAVTAAFSVGELSYSKVRAVTRVATTATEGTLVELARSMTASQLERSLRCYRHAGDAADGDEEPPGDPTENYRDRYFSTRWKENGNLAVRGELPPAEGEMFLVALRRAMDDLYRQSHHSNDSGDKDGDGDGDGDDTPGKAEAGADDADVDASGGGGDVPAGTPLQDVAAESPPPWDRWAARAADAVAAMAESVVSDGLRPGSGPNRHTVVIHTNASDWTATDDAAAGHVEDGPHLPGATVRRLMCDASLMFALDGDDGKVINVSPRAPSVPTALARAVKLRDRCCVFPGCTHQAFVDVHHLHHRVDGGENSQANLACLCRVHHRMVHEGGFTMTSPAPGRFRFYRSDGTALPTSPRQVRAGDDAIRQYNAAHGVDPDAETSVPDWDGRHPDYPMIVDLLLGTDGRLEYRPPSNN